MMIRPLFSNSRPHALLHRVHSSAHLHSNDHGPGQGFFGSLREKYAAEEAFEEGQAALLRVVGLGISGKGDWNALFESGAIYEIDPNYLQVFGFFQVGGEMFTRNRGLRGHLVEYIKGVTADYEEAWKVVSTSLCLNSFMNTSVIDAYFTLARLLALCLPSLCLN